MVRGSCPRRIERLAGRHPANLSRIGLVDAVGVGYKVIKDLDHIPDEDAAVELGLESPGRRVLESVDRCLRYGKTNTEIISCPKCPTTGFPSFSVASCQVSCGRHCSERCSPSRRRAAWTKRVGRSVLRIGQDLR